MCREVRAERAGAGERIDKQRKSETGRIVKAAKTCEEVVDGAPDQAGKCAKGKCISIGENRVCTQCGKTTTEAPKNGVCTDLTSDTAICATKDSGKCTKCAGDSFMYKGGCYEQSDPLGTTICEATNSNGVCTVAKPGYFVPPSDIDASHDSVVSCGDTTGVTFSNGGNTKTYKGVDGCETCTAPKTINGGSGAQTAAATCTKCGSSKIVKTAAGVTSCVTEAQCTGTERFFVKEGNPKTCVACNENCKMCSGGNEADKCTSCKTDTLYLKKTDGLQTGTCVDANGCTTDNTYYADDTVDPTNGKLCRKCTEGGVTVCTTCEKIESGVVYKECTEETAIFGLEKKSCVKTALLIHHPIRTAFVCSSDSDFPSSAIVGIFVAAILIVDGSSATRRSRLRRAVNSRLVSCSLLYFSIRSSRKALFGAASRARIGQVPRLLPSLDVRAVSQARSPESNPDSPPGVGPGVMCSGARLSLESPRSQSRGRQHSEH